MNQVVEDQEVIFIFRFVIAEGEFLSNWKLLERKAKMYKNLLILPFSEKNKTL